MPSVKLPVFRPPKLPKAELPAKIADPKPPKLSTSVKSQRAPHPRRPAAFPRGKRLWKGPKQSLEGPGEPPVGFLTVTNSRTEWMVYWALWILLHEPGDVRTAGAHQIGGFHGGTRFQYQVAANDGRLRNLGSVSDFVIKLTPTVIIWLRVDTAYYHSNADPSQKARDLYVRTHDVPPGVIVRSVFDQDFVGDPSGKAVLRAVQDALNYIERPNPATSGTAYPVASYIPGVLV
jgi:hypothetical protein